VVMQVFRSAKGPRAITMKIRTHASTRAALGAPQRIPAQDLRVDQSMRKRLATIPMAANLSMTSASPSFPYAETTFAKGMKKLHALAIAERKL